MAIVTRPLTVTEVQKVKPSSKPWYMFDGRGLCLQITPKGRKFWHCRYKRPATGKATFVSLGYWPDLSLADARLEHQKFIALLAKGIDTKTLEREAKEQVKIAEETRFHVVDEKWHSTKKQDYGTASRANLVIAGKQCPTGDWRYSGDGTESPRPDRRAQTH